MLKRLHNALTRRETTEAFSPIAPEERSNPAAPEPRRSNPVAQVLVAQETEKSAAQIIRSLQPLLANADCANELTGALNKLQKSLASAITEYTPAENARIEPILNTLSQEIQAINKEITTITRTIKHEFDQLCIPINSTSITPKDRVLAESSALRVITEILDPNLRMTLLERFITHCQATKPDLTQEEKKLVTTTLSQLTSGPRLTKEGAFIRMQSLLQKIQNTRAKTKTDQAWVDSKKVDLYRARTLKAIISEKNRTYTAISLCLLGSESTIDRLKNGIELLLSHAFAKNGPQTLRPGNLLDSTLELIGERSKRTPLEILNDCLQRYLDAMPSEILAHTLATQIERSRALNSKPPSLEGQKRDHSSKSESIDYAETIIKAIGDYLQSIDTHPQQ